MIIFDYKCDTCETVEEKLVKTPKDEFFCGKCNMKMYRIFTPTNFYPFKSFVSNDIADEPITIDSWRKLDKECEKRGLGYNVGPIRRHKTRVKRKPLEVGKYVPTDI
jgi:hypothetical protein